MAVALWIAAVGSVGISWYVDGFHAFVKWLAEDCGYDTDDGLTSALMTPPIYNVLAVAAFAAWVAVAAWIWSAQGWRWSVVYVAARLLLWQWVLYRFPFPAEQHYSGIVERRLKRSDARECAAVVARLLSAVRAATEKN